jgi:hypothetical protein
MLIGDQGLFVSITIGFNIKTLKYSLKRCGGINLVKDGWVLS